MLTLFSAYDTPESQHWATWEVCNMIIKDRKYTHILGHFYDMEGEGWSCWEVLDSQIVVVQCGKYLQTFSSACTYCQYNSQYSSDRVGFLAISNQKGKICFDNLLWYILADRYIKMFTEEGGVQLVEKLLEDPRPYEEIKALARELLDMCRAHNPLAEVEV